ncbi:aspartyl/asparaginyl beta-hydroxylase domain-containing protein [Luteimonas vadosa]|uniref:Aspartyl/asparaginy/proline hydroxylase domain-containing protein n=1 Tax=Luteimonas vadosa TaxID=1165507 RepID=A0ABP9E5W2_9GAMM
MDPDSTQFLDAISAAGSVEEIELACQRLSLDRLAAAPPSGRDAFRAGLAVRLHAHLSGKFPHPGFRRWVDSYFGCSRETFRSPLQQPNYIYYPALPPVPWIPVQDHPGLPPLIPALPEVAEEISGFLADDRAFAPYVSAEAARDARWRELAANPAWSSLHLIKGGVRDEAMLSALPRTRAFLAAAPLAEFPPHAPECFISRLMPGVRLPPHFGVSNIKLTVHVPIELPPAGCSITVAGVTRGWRQGEMLVFDDSFEHSAQNLSRQSRTVLIFDAWHPGLGGEEREALAYSIRALDLMNGILARIA